MTKVKLFVVVLVLIRHYPYSVTGKAVHFRPAQLRVSWDPGLVTCFVGYFQAMTKSFGGF